MARAALKQARADWAKARRAEAEYASQLRKIARVVADIMRAFNPDDPSYADEAAAALGRYAEIIDPWARAVANRMMTEVAARSDREWRKVSAQMGAAIRQQFSAPDQTGMRFRGILEGQVGLIKSIPRDAAVRVHEQAREGVIQGKRFSEIAKALQAEQPGISARHATLIARTETGRVTTTLTQSRAESAGSTHFIWRTSRDSDVRPSHRALDGTTFLWSEPPECDPGHRALPGCIWNCRCYAEPVIPMPDERVGSPTRARFLAYAA